MRRIFSQSVRFEESEEEERAAERSGEKTLEDIKTEAAKFDSPPLTQHFSKRTFSKFSFSPPKQVKSLARGGAAGAGDNKDDDEDDRLRRSSESSGNRGESSDEDSRASFDYSGRTSSSPLGEEDEEPFMNVSRFPFLALLFSSRTVGFSSYDGIAADEQDRENENNPLVDIFLWRDPAASMMWFLTLQTVYFLLLFCDFTFLTIASVLALWQMCYDAAVVHLVGPWLQRAGIVPKRVDLKAFVRRSTFFNERLVRQMGSAAFELHDLLVGLWKIVVFEGSIYRVAIALRFIFVVMLRSFSLAITMYLFFMALFTLPIGYQKNTIISNAIFDSVITRIFLEGRRLVGYSSAQLARVSTRRLEIERGRTRTWIGDYLYYRVMEVILSVQLGIGERLIAFSERKAVEILSPSISRRSPSESLGSISTKST